MLTLSSIMAVLYSVLALSNATKNQRDNFSSFVQSYVSDFKSILNYIHVLFLISYEFCDIVIQSI